MTKVGGDRQGVLERASRLLASFSAEEPLLAASQIAERTGFALSSVHRLLGKLIDLGYIEKVPPRRYAVGLRLFEIGELNPVLLDFRESAIPQMQRLYEATGENVQLAVLDGRAPSTARVLYIGRVVGVASSVTRTRIGGSFPLHTTGVGKALLAEQEPKWLEEYIRGGLAKETPHSIVRGEDLLIDLQRTRARGYSVVREEMSLGTASIGVALDPVAHLPLTAIGVVTDVARFRERELSAMVSSTAQQLRTLLSERLDP